MRKYAILCCAAALLAWSCDRELDLAGKYDNTDSSKYHGQ